MIQNPSFAQKSDQIYTKHTETHPKNFFQNKINSQIFFSEPNLRILMYNTFATAWLGASCLPDLVKHRSFTQEVNVRLEHIAKHQNNLFLYQSAGDGI